MIVLTSWARIGLAWRERACSAETGTKSAKGFSETGVSSDVEAVVVVSTGDEDSEDVEGAVETGFEGVEVGLEVIGGGRGVEGEVAALAEVETALMRAVWNEAAAMVVEGWYLRLDTASLENERSMIVWCV